MTSGLQRIRKIARNRNICRKATACSSFPPKKRFSALRGEKQRDGGEQKQVSKHRPVPHRDWPTAAPDFFVKNGLLY